MPRSLPPFTRFLIHMLRRQDCVIGLTVTFKVDEEHKRHDQEIPDFIEHPDEQYSQRMIRNPIPDEVLPVTHQDITDTLDEQSAQLGLDPVTMHRDYLKAMYYLPAVGGADPAGPKASS